MQSSQKNPKFEKTWKKLIKNKLKKYLQKRDKSRNQKIVGKYIRHELRFRSYAKGIHLLSQKCQKCKYSKWSFIFGGSN